MGSGNRTGQEELYDSFLQALEDETFLALAAFLLDSGDDARRLAECAERAAGRMPGGPLYRVRLWAKILKLLAPDGIVNGTGLRLAEMCQQVGTNPHRAKRLAALGNVAETLERQRIKLDGLLHATQQIFDAAPKQKERAEMYFRFVNKLLRGKPQLTARQVQRAWCERHGSQKANLDIIKPSDWWAFSHPKWRRDPHFPGSIPGEVYANALYYFAPRKGVAVDPMAGSGMLLRVYQDRNLWQKDSDFNLDIRLFDLHPVRDFIKKHDARRPLPLKADWIFLDPPYFGQSSHLYGDELANAATYPEYLAGLEKVIQAMAASLRADGRLCIFLPKWSGPSNGENHDVPSDACRCARQSGLAWLDCAFVSRARQQTRGFAFQNIAAKRSRRMLSDTCILNVFQKVRN
jgi:hypothetical protein